jgi:hypothetical protein
MPGKKNYVSVLFAALFVLLALVMAAGSGCKGPDPMPVPGTTPTPHTATPTITATFTHTQTPVCASPGTYGLSGVGSNEYVAPASPCSIFACAVTLLSAAKPVSFSLYLSAVPANPRLYLAIYTDDGNYPGDRVLDWNTTNVTTGWNTLGLSGDMSAQTIWLAWHFENGATFAYNPAGGAFVAADISASCDTTPDPFPAGGTVTSYAGSVYLSACPP